MCQLLLFLDDSQTAHNLDSIKHFVGIFVHLNDSFSADELFAICCLQKSEKNTNNVNDQMV